METFRIITGGLGTGFALSLMLGTVFFALLQSSINSGIKSGLAIATGVITCDLIFVALALWSSTFTSFLNSHVHLVTITGGIVLLALGISVFLKKAPVEKPMELNKGGLRIHTYYFVKGFLLNVMNPVNFFSWLSISTMLTVKLKYTIQQQILFFLCSIAAIWITEALISYFATKLKILATPKALKWVNRISGIIFGVTGLVLIIRELL